ncbi:hypothetical protein [Comamonas composti]|uniref:hypothetical protein n=1 Tax=Comamonas composti TaxID=408558 RepID=UPI000428FBA3|nr:hypothetical protein [Comamonas composti]
MRKINLTGRHPILAFALTALLALVAGASTLWLDHAASAADTLLQKNPEDFLPSFDAAPGMHHTTPRKVSSSNKYQSSLRLPSTDFRLIHI